MAHSSMKVQKLGPSSFSRPMMKVGQVTPSPRNRRTSSSCGSAGGETSSCGPGSTAKGRYRGVILATPTKRPAGSRSFTPSSASSSSDSIFQSSSKLSLKSSPPVAVWHGSEDKAQDDSFQQFKFALTIGENGRATIAGSSPLSSPVKEKPDVEMRKLNAEVSSEAPQTAVTSTEKSRVLSLLRQMRNTTGSASGSQTRSRVLETQESSFSSSVNSNSENLSSSMLRSPQMPSTPRTSFTMRTGFTPNTGIDQVLLDIVSTPKAGLYGGNDGHTINFGIPSNFITFSPKGRIPVKKTQEGKAQQDKLEAQRQQYVFKFSSADPLLLTDDVEGNWSEVIYNQTQGSPKHQLCFNTPPSWVNWGSPRAFSPQRLDTGSVLISACQGTAVEKERFNRGHSQNGGLNVNSPPFVEPISAKNGSDRVSAEKAVVEPSTPKSYNVPMTTVVGCTPLIQQTMNGSLAAKYVPGLLAGGPMEEAVAEQMKPVPVVAEQEDARVALKRLVADR